MKEPLEMNEIVYFKEHMANERTFLAWVRTGMGIMAFGFVIERFGLFIKETMHFFMKFQAVEDIYNPSSIQKSSALFGIILVLLGGLICLFSFIDYKRNRKEIEKGYFFPSTKTEVLLVICIFAITLFLAASSLFNF